MPPKVGVDECLLEIQLDARRVVAADQAGPLRPQSKVSAKETARNGRLQTHLLPSVVVNVARPRVGLVALARQRRVGRRVGRVPGGQLGPRIPLHKIRALRKLLAEDGVRAVGRVSTQLTCGLKPAAEQERIVCCKQRVQVSKQVNVQPALTMAAVTIRCG